VGLLPFIGAHISSKFVDFAPISVGNFRAAQEAAKVNLVMD